ncbi:hypothetical protein FRD01_11950 [Microvenator marinus]|uniref:Gluconate 2-dehydrogenase subunit 3 family protein n=1 Tax=Microvenator marinus TaxID=2600177 RepID=A0A5B8XW19_9DELT|nr:gluconate 2-dehydrogenase subunit 3 family protein [Microvenator marinus]QED27936.1 hypothetical protein FRD01_11950 [Microvenator marinus]
MKRRTFLRWGIACGAIALGGLALSWPIIGDFPRMWDEAPGAGFKVLTDEEALITRALAGGIFPGDQTMPSGENLGLDHFFDEYLAVIPRQTATLLRILIRSIDRMAMYDFGGRLHTRNILERVEVVEAWDQSSSGIRRTIFQSIKVLLAMGYFEHPDVLRAAGIEYECGGMG